MKQDRYVRHQIKVAKKLLGERYFHLKEMELIAKFLRAQGKGEKLIGMCHGARNGREVEEFQNQFPKATVYGTDVFPQGENVVRWNFNQPLKSWRAKFDFIYSNSLDHSPDPLETLQVWVNQLKQRGFLFIQWTFAHAKRNTGKGGNLYRGSLLEYIDLISKRARIWDVMYSRPYTRAAFVIACSRKRLRGVVEPYHVGLPKPDTYCASSCESSIPLPRQAAWEVHP